MWKVSGIRSLRALIREGCRLPLYGRLVDSQTLLVSTDEKVKEKHFPGYEWPVSSALELLVLPTLENADGWWKKLLANDEIHYWVHYNRLMGFDVCCAAKRGIWHRLPQLYMNLSKDNFRRVSTKTFHKRVGASTHKEMDHDVFFFGISVRRVTNL